MNPITNMKNLNKMNDREIEMGVAGTGKSWHNEYKDSAWIFAGGLPYDLTEGDVICVFSQYGEIVHINLIRDQKTGKSKGFGFICYEDQLSTILAVDNLNGMKLLGRLVRVDHVHTYKLPKDLEKMDEDRKKLFLEGCAPKPIEQEPIKEEEVEVEEILDYKSEKKKKKKEKKSKKAKKKSKKKHKRKDYSSDSSDSDDNSDEDQESERSQSKRDQVSDKSSKRSPSPRDFDRKRISKQPVSRDRSRSTSRDRHYKKSRDTRDISRDTREMSRDAREISRDVRKERSRSRDRSGRGSNNPPSFSRHEKRYRSRSNSREDRRRRSRS